MVYTHFTKTDRLEISILLKKGYSIRAIAKVLCKDHSSVSREIHRNIVKGEYDSKKAQKKSLTRRRHSKSQGMKVRNSSVIEEYVHEKMKIRWSPEIIAGRLKLDKGISLKPDTIYKYLYSRYGHNLCQYLKYKQDHRRHKRKTAAHPLIPERIWIDERPQEINGRKSFGHFEGDTMGRPQRASRETLVVARERLSRKVFAIKVAEIRQAMQGFQLLFSKLPVRSLTLDNGLENVAYRTLKVPTYFCHPYSSWEKGSVEEGIRRIRQFIPKKADLSNYSPKDIDAMIKTINNRPMKCLNFYTPNEVFSLSSGALEGGM